MKQLSRREFVTAQGGADVPETAVRQPGGVDRVANHQTREARSEHPDRAVVVGGGQRAPVLGSDGAGRQRGETGDDED